MVYYNTFSNKYGAKKTVYNGRRYDSKLEARVAQDLDLRMESGEFTEIIPQYKISLYVYLPDGSRADLFSYICDFRCERTDGSYLLIEAKGMETSVFRVKKRILDLVWLPDHPGYEYEIIKQCKSYNTM
jgi:hypothetical protein